MHALSNKELQYRQSLPLDVKEVMTRNRIKAFIAKYGESGVYVSFSGGKDSTVLLHQVRKYYPDVEAVFLNKEYYLYTQKTGTSKVRSMETSHAVGVSYRSVPKGS